MNKILQFSVTGLMLLGFNAGFSQEATLESTFMFKKMNDITIPFQSGIPYGSFEKQKSRSIIDLAGSWKKQRFNAVDQLTLAKRDAQGLQNIITEANNRQLKNYDDSSWETKAIPAVENNMNAYQKAPEYYEDGVWYRRKFFVESNKADQVALLKFYAANYVTDVWVNGTYIGWHEGGYTSFMFDISNAIVAGDTNTIAVRIDNIKWKTRNDIVPYTIPDWFNYTGIVHDVYVEFTDPISVSRADVVTTATFGDFDLRLLLWNPKKANKSLTVSVSAYDVNLSSATYKTELVSDMLGGKTNLTGSTDFQLSTNGDSVIAVLKQLTIPGAKLWAPQKPNLYALNIKVYDGAKLLDEFVTQIGIRKVEVAGNKINLNGVPTFFTAVARHEDHPTYGRSIPKSIIVSDIEKVKSVNASQLRTAHYPNHPFTYLMTDRVGVSVMEEIPVWWFDSADAWIIQNERRHIHEQMWREMIFRDYNRPSIFLWSATNECLDVTNRKIFIDKIHTELDTQYPDGRLVTQSAAADRPGPEDASQFSVDVPGWTMYWGVFYGNDETIDTKRFLADIKKVHPNKPVIATEFGRWSKEDFSEQGAQTKIFGGTYDAFAGYNARAKLGALIDTGFVAVTTWWCIFDWYQYANPNGFQSMGLYQMDRTSAKTVADILKSRYLTYYLTAPVATDVEPNKTDKSFRLNQNYPNPFNPNTMISYRLSVAGNVELKVYDLSGREIATLFSGYKPAGEYTVEFGKSTALSSFASGIYLYKLKTDHYSETKKMVLIK